MNECDETDEYSRLTDAKETEEVLNGICVHGFNDHKAEFNCQTESEYRKVAEDTIKNGDLYIQESNEHRNDAKGYYDVDTKALVIHNLDHPEDSTCYKFDSKKAGFDTIDEYMKFKKFRNV